MARSYGEIAFTDSVRKQQEKYGSRNAYARLEASARGAELTFTEADFIAERDSFYLATVGENGYPYVQFRGGPKGFLQVLDARTVAYADFRGNRQYISVGNLARSDKAALILMDYPNRRRLKIYARVEVMEAGDAPALVARLHRPAYKAQVERAMVLHVEAFDWNCQQHITPRYTLEQVRELSASLHERIARLQAELAALKAEGAGPSGTKSSPAAVAASDVTTVTSA